MFNELELFKFFSVNERAADDINGSIGTSEKNFIINFSTAKTKFD